jgi:hypothetical protein
MATSMLRGETRRLLGEILELRDRKRGRVASESAGGLSDPEVCSRCACVFARRGSLKIGSQGEALRAEAAELRSRLAAAERELSAMRAVRAEASAQPQQARGAVVADAAQLAEAARRARQGAPQVVVMQMGAGRSSSGNSSAGRPQLEASAAEELEKFVGQDD